MASEISSSRTNTNKKKRKRSSPFRIKVGCLVALRYRPRGNQIQLERPDGTLLQSSEGNQPEEEGGLENSKCKCYDDYEENVISANFSEVWTDPLPGHDDGLALIGSRIRCFFPKAVFSEPYRATSRLLEGEVVNVVQYCEEQYAHRLKNWRKRQAVGTLVDLLIDNKDDKQLKALPFLQRIDERISDKDLASMSEVEKRNHKFEQRIQGGPHKATVRVLLSDEASTGIKLNKKSKKNLLVAQWVVRKRVPTKIVRMRLMEKNNDAGQASTASKEESIDNGEATKATEEGNESSNNHPKDTKEDVFAESPKKRQKVVISNKDFSLPRYLGDGNDPPSQQEANWRWLAGKYNPCSVLADRPLSKELLERLSYNFVGEVVRIRPETSPNSTSLAAVTIRRIVLPEHTVTGRLSQHGPFDAFDDEDLKMTSLLAGPKNGTSEIVTSEIGKQDPLKSSNKDQSCLLRIPIEELVIVRRKVVRAVGPDALEDSALVSEITIRKAYSFHSDTYTSLKSCQAAPQQNGEASSGEESRSEAEQKRCVRCRHTSLAVKRLAGVPHLLCESCTKFLKEMKSKMRNFTNESKKFRCDCDGCISRLDTDLVSDLSKEVLGSVSRLGSTLEGLGDYSAQEDSGFISTRFVVKGMHAVDFAVNPYWSEPLLSSSSSKPITKVVSKVSRKTKKSPSLSFQSTSGNDGSVLINKKFPIRQLGQERNGDFFHSSPRKEVFRPTSARLLPYDAIDRKFDVSATEIYQWKMFDSSSASTVYPEKPRNLRRLVNDAAAGAEDVTAGKKKLLGRAARAHQRRLAKSIAAMGVNMDTLAGREQQLRFDRSGIHDWGVFVDVDIQEGEMIVEYRGEIIGNAVAEKREKEYEAAKIGSDYMFRMDDLTVCDATKQGNVARFINASCDPNCYTKIISSDGTKRIVVYAKRDIKSGEELSYDYKFPLEYDPAQRIPCRCGARECRGFLNWDKKYADVPIDDEANGDNHSVGDARMKGVK